MSLVKNSQQADLVRTPSDTGPGLSFVQSLQRVLQQNIR